MSTSQGTGSLTARVGSNIRAARDAQKLTQRALAHQVGVNEMLVSKWERGVHLPSGENLGALAVTLGCDIGWFYRDPAELREAA